MTDDEYKEFQLSGEPYSTIWKPVSEHDTVFRDGEFVSQPVTGPTFNYGPVLSVAVTGNEESLRHQVALSHDPVLTWYDRHPSYPNRLVAQYELLKNVLIEWTAVKIAYFIGREPLGMYMGSRVKH